MSAAGFYDRTFKPNGDDYFSLPVHVVAGLEPFWRTAALEVGAALMILAREENNFDPTSREIAARLPSNRGQAEGSPPGHRSISFVQKGLAILDGPVLDDDGKVVRPGLDLIDRVRRGGKRFITWVKGLKPRRGPKEKETSTGPPSTPPEQIKIQIQTTTTREPSSSSLAALPGNGPELPADLLDAVGLVPDLSRERLLGWVRLADPELARRVVAWLRAWLRHPRAENRPRGAFWAEKALLRWKDGLDRGELTFADIDQMIAAKERKWVPKPAAKPAAKPAEEPPPHRLTAEELADLVARCTAGDRSLMKYARVELRLALKGGKIDPELRETIPAELLEPDPRAP
jgi:hypothetical protein